MGHFITVESILGDSVGSGENMLRKVSKIGVYSPDPTDCPWVF